jgi:hypothetical protein
MPKIRNNNRLNRKRISKEMQNLGDGVKQISFKIVDYYNLDNIILIFIIVHGNRCAIAKELSYLILTICSSNVSIKVHYFLLFAILMD